MKLSIKKVLKPLYIIIAIIILFLIYAALVWYNLDYAKYICYNIGGEDFTPDQIPYSLLAREFRREIPKDEYYSIINGDDAEELFQLFIRLDEISQSKDFRKIYGQSNIHMGFSGLNGELTGCPSKGLLYTFQSEEYEYKIWYFIYVAYNQFNPVDIITKNVRLIDFQIRSMSKEAIVSD
jgi:hypothetical protein